MIFLFLTLCVGFGYTSSPFDIKRNLFEGDILLTPDQLREVEDGDSNNALAASRFPLWPHIIPYDLYTLGTNPKARKAIADAMREFHKHTCLRFVPRTNQRSYIRFEDSKGCGASIGVRKGNPTQIGLGKKCWVKGIVMHEIMHALGFWHEQTRPDRDDYVTIVTNMIAAGAENNFVKHTYAETRDLGEPYDYNSVMHYKQYEFSRHYRTPVIITKDPSWQTRIGQREGFSEGDKRKINKLYKCGDASTWMTTPVIPTLNPNCNDTYAMCTRYVDRCNKPSDAFHKWVVKSCRKSCGLC